MLLYAPGHAETINEPIQGNTWLQKQTYELSKTMPQLNSGFGEYDFGTFSQVLGSILSKNKASNLIDQRPDGGCLQLSHGGMEIAEQIWNDSSPEERMLVSNTKKFFNDMSYWEIIAFSYPTHPNATANSTIGPGFEKNRLSAAVDLFKKHKASLKKAAIIAGISTEEFEEELLKRQIHPYELDEEKYRKSLKIIENIT